MRRNKTAPPPPGRLSWGVVGRETGVENTVDKEGPVARSHEKPRVRYRNEGGGGAGSSREEDRFTS